MFQVAVLLRLVKVRYKSILQRCSYNHKDSTFIIPETRNTIHKDRIHYKVYIQICLLSIQDGSDAS